MKEKVGIVMHHDKSRGTYRISSEEIEFEEVTEVFFHFSDYFIRNGAVFKELSGFCFACDVELFYNEDTQVFYCPACKDEYEPSELS